MRKSNRYKIVSGIKGHPRQLSNGGVLEHIVIAEKALGRHLPKGAQVHHVDGDGFNNTPSNLVICESQAYHFWLHKRAKAKKECGHASWVPCIYCKAYEPIGEMVEFLPNYLSTSYQYYHKKCRSEYMARRYKRKKRRQLESGVNQAPYDKLKFVLPKPEKMNKG